MKKRLPQQESAKRGPKPRKQGPLSLAPLTAEEALKRMLGGAPAQETRPESMVPRAKPKQQKK
jgi:hypothetical protein